MTGSVTHEFDLIASGPLPIWAGALLALLLAVLTAWVIRREAGTRKQSGKSTAVRLALRVSIAVLLAMLVAQPVLYVRRIETRPGQLILVADRSRSMTRVDPLDATSLFNLASELERPGAQGRPDAAEKIQRLWQFSRAELTQFRELAAAAANDLSRGVPPSAASVSQLLAQTQAVESLTGKMQPLLNQLGKSTLTPTTQPAEDWLAAVEKPLHELADLPRVISAIKEKAIAADAALAIVTAYDRLLAAVDASMPVLGRVQLQLDRQFLVAMPAASRKELESLAGMSRFELASAFASRVTADVPLTSSHRVVLRGFDLLDSALASPHTDLYHEVDSATPAGLDDAVAGVVLLSDGQQNLPDRPEVMARLRGRGIPFVAVGVGSAEAIADVAVIDYQVQGVIQRDKKATLTARLKTQLPAGTPVGVTLAMPDGQVVGRAKAQAGASGTADAAIDFRLADAGHRVLTLSVSGPQPDSAPENDSAAVPVFVTDRQPRALVIAHWARWDMVHVTQALAGRAVRADSIFWGQLGKAPARGSNPGAIPDSLESLRRYQLVILDGSVFDGMKPDDQKLFSDFVTQGGNLWVVQSETAGYLDAWPWLGGAPQEAPGASKLAPAQGTDGIPMVQLAADSAASRSAWASLAPVRKTSRVTPGNLPLLADDHGETLMSLSFFGRGKIYRLGVSDLFHTRNWGGGTSADRFLSGVIDDALTPLFANADSLATIYPPIPRSGLDAFVLAPEAAAASLRTPDQKAVALSPAGENAGKSAGVFRMTAPKAGAFEIVAGEKTIAAGQSIRAVSMEDLDFQLSPSRLKEVAAPAGGKYVPLSEAIQAIRQLPASVERIVSVRHFDLGTMFLLLPLMAVIMTLDWYLRRKSGLVL